MHIPYRTEVRNDCIRVFGVHDFHLDDTFMNGQCFRWQPLCRNAYLGIAHKKAIKIYRQGSDLVLVNTNQHDFETLWAPYLTLDIDYGALKAKFREDPLLKKAIDSAPGMRLLRQEFHETLISFILSSNNNIARVRKIISNLCEWKGDRISAFCNTYRSFPSLDTLLNMKERDFLQCGAGYRSAYLVSTIQKMAACCPNPQQLESCSLADAREILQSFPGIGPKVADCILLYSGVRYDVFPTDVWVKRIVEQQYLLSKASIKDILVYANNRFGTDAGFAQQYLFHYARMSEKDAKANEHPSFNC